MSTAGRFTRVRRLADQVGEDFFEVGMFSLVEFGQERFAPSRECPHLRIEIWGTRFCGVNLDVGHRPAFSGPPVALS